MLWFNIILQITVMPIVEISYYLVLSVVLPLISAFVAVTITIFNINDSAIGDLRTARIPWWCEYSCGMIGLVLVWGVGQDIFWFVGIAQTIMLLLRRFETRLHRIDNTVAERMQAVLLRM